jgi:hypothetical protein
MFGHLRKVKSSNFLEWYARSFQNFCDIEILVIFSQEIDNFNQMYIRKNYISPQKSPNVFVEETTKFVEKGIKKILETLVLPP